jgi:membrane protein
MTLILVSLVLAFIGGQLAEDLLGFVGLGEDVARLWNLARWPAAIVLAMLVFSYVYYVTPDVQHRAFHWITPGAAVAVLLWLLASFGFAQYLSRVADAAAVYGAFAGPIVLVGWLWLTNLAMLFGAELNAEIEREKELGEGTPEHDTLNRPARDA